MKKVTSEEFVKKAVRVHGDYYDYSLVNYAGAFVPVVIICPKHGGFTQKPSYHLDKCGCPKCGLFRRDAKLRKSKDFIKRSVATHGDVYDYSLAEYINGFSPVTIICRKHGKFNQSPNNHRLGSGCPLCYRSIHLKNFLIERLQEVHNGRYDYSLITQEIIKPDDKIKIICPEHGMFEQRKRAHLAGQDCPACRGQNSKAQISWIGSFNNKNIISPYKLIDVKKALVDGFDPTSKTVYEFYGDFWHGNPKKFASNEKHPMLNMTFGELYLRTIEKENRIRTAGYKLICVWENDWRNR